MMIDCLWRKPTSWIDSIPRRIWNPSLRIRGITRLSITSKSYISSDDDQLWQYWYWCQPESSGKTKGAPWLGSAQFGKVFRLQLHNHVVEPGNNGHNGDDNGDDNGDAQPIISAASDEATNMLSPLKLLQNRHLRSSSSALLTSVSSSSTTSARSPYSTWKNSHGPGKILSHTHFTAKILKCKLILFFRKKLFYCDRLSLQVRTITFKSNDAITHNHWKLGKRLQQSADDGLRSNFHLQCLKTRTVLEQFSGLGFSFFPPLSWHSSHFSLGECWCLRWLNHRLALITLAFKTKPIVSRLH